MIVSVYNNDYVPTIACPSCHIFNYKKQNNIMSAIIANSAATATTISSEYIEYSTGSLQLSAYHFHHNREPFIIMFAKKDSIIYLEKIDPHSNRHKYVNEIVMPFDEMVKNENLKKFYDMSVMMVNTDKTIYYDTIGVETGQLVDNYDNYDSYSEDEECEERKIVLRHWCINCDTNWKNLRVSKQTYYNCYYNMNPHTYEYNVNTDKEINNFMSSFNAWAKYNYVPSFIENIIVANYNYQLRLIRN